MLFDVLPLLLMLLFVFLALLCDSKEYVFCFHSYGLYGVVDAVVVVVDVDDDFDEAATVVDFASELLVVDADIEVDADAAAVCLASVTSSSGVLAVTWGVISRLFRYDLRPAELNSG